MQLLFVGVVFVLGATCVNAQTNYPTKPIRFVIANTTGTSVDTLARIAGAKMSELFGQQMVADNRGGAGGLIGAAAERVKFIHEQYARFGQAIKLAKLRVA